MSSVWSLPALLARLSFSDAAALHSALLDLSREAFFGDDPLPLPSLEQFTHFLSALSYLYPLYLPDPPIRSTALLLFLLLLGLRSIQPPPLCFGSEHEDVAFLDFVRVQRLLQLRELSDDLRHSPRRCLRLLCLAAHLFRYRSDQSTGQDTGRSEKERLINVRVVSLDKVEVDKSCLSTSAGSTSGSLHAFEGTVHRIGRVQSIPDQSEEVEDDWRSSAQVRCELCTASASPPTSSKKVKVEVTKVESGEVDVQAVELLLTINPAAVCSTGLSLSGLRKVSYPLAQHADLREQAKSAVATRLSQDRLLHCMLRRDLVGSVGLADRVRVIGYPRLRPAEKAKVEAKRVAKGAKVEEDDEEKQASYSLLVHSVVINPPRMPISSSALASIRDALTGHDQPPFELLISRPLSLAMPADLPSEVNAGLLLALMSAGLQDELTDSGAGIHVLLVCGTGQQTVLAPLALLHPHAVYVSSLPTSTSLWATETCGKQGIEQVDGALMQANGGVCLVDELDRHVANPAAAHRLTHFLRTGEDLVISDGGGASQVELRSSATVIATTRGRWTEYDNSLTLMDNAALPVEVVAAFDLVLIAGLPNRDYEATAQQVLKMDSRWRDVDAWQTQREAATVLPPLLTPAQLTTFLMGVQQAAPEYPLRISPQLGLNLERWYLTMKALSLMNGHLPQQLRPSPRTLRTFLHVYLAYARINSDRKNALPCAVDVMRASLRDLCRDWDGQPMDLAEAVRQTAAAAAPLTRIQPKHGQVEKFWKLLKQQPQDEVNTAIILELARSGQAKAIGLSGDAEQTDLLIERLSAHHNAHFLQVGAGRWKIQR